MNAVNIARAYSFTASLSEITMMNKTFDKYIVDLFPFVKDQFTADTLFDFAVSESSEIINTKYSHIKEYIENTILTPEQKIYKLFVSKGVNDKDEMYSTIVDVWHKDLNDVVRWFLQRYIGKI